MTPSTPSSTFTEAELAFLSQTALGRLATVQPSGVVQNNPVGFTVIAEGAIEIGGYNMTASQKFRNAGQGGHGSLVVDEIVSRRPWHVRGVEIRGVLEADRATAVIRLHPRRIFRWGLSDDETGIQRRNVTQA